MSWLPKQPPAAQEEFYPMISKTASSRNSKLFSMYDTVQFNA